MHTDYHHTVCALDAKKIHFFSCLLHLEVLQLLIKMLGHCQNVTGINLLCSCNVIIVLFLAFLILA